MEILVYKGNLAPLFPTRFWPFSSLSLESILIAKTIFWQVAWSRCCDLRAGRIGGETHFRRCHRG